MKRSVIRYRIIVALLLLVVLGLTMGYPLTNTLLFRAQAEVITPIVMPHKVTGSSARLPLQMGSNVSYLGNGNAVVPGTGGTVNNPPQNFWLQVKAPYTQSAFGDAYGSYVGLPYEAPKPPAAPDHSGRNKQGYYGCTANDPYNTSNRQPLVNSDCTRGGIRLNPANNNGGFSGYNYAVNVLGNGSVNVSLYNSTYTDDNMRAPANPPGIVDDDGCHREPGYETKDFNALPFTQCWDWSTIYTITDPNGALVPVNKNSGCDPTFGNPYINYAHESAATQRGLNQAIQWCILNSGPGLYTINVKTVSGDQRTGKAPLANYGDLSTDMTRPAGGNDFGIFTTGATAAVYALGSICIGAFMDSTNGGTSHFQLVKVPASDAGKILRLRMFDVGDTAGNGDVYINDPTSAQIVHVVTTVKGAANYDNAWVQVDYPLPANFAGGWFTVDYVYSSRAVDTSTWEASIEDPAVTNFTFSPKNVVAGLTTLFRDTSTSNPTGWQWDFGDGTPVSASQNPTHTFSGAGNYNVVLKVNSPTGSFTITHTVRSNLIVVNNSDNGLGDTGGTLSYDLLHAHASDVITFTLTLSNTIQLSGGPLNVPTGVRIAGSCSNGVPGVIIDGSRTPAGTNGLILNGNDNLSGVQLRGFSGKSLVVKGKGNKGSCVRVVR